MAVPASATTKDTSGKYILNTKLSTPHDDVLKAQGVSYINRNAIAWTTVTMELTHTFTTDYPSETIIFKNSVLSGIIKGTSGVYVFPCKELKHTDHVFGSVLITAERKPIADITSPFLREGWTSDVETSPFPTTKGVLWTYTVPDKMHSEQGWSAEQVWGYAEHDIPGLGRQKRYTRRIHFVSPSLTKDVLLIYDTASQGSGVDAVSKPAAHQEEDLSSYGST